MGIAELLNRNSNPLDPEKKLAQTASDSLTGEGKSSTDKAIYKDDSRGSKSNDTKSNTEESKSQEARYGKLKHSGTNESHSSGTPNFKPNMAGLQVAAPEQNDD